MSKAESVTSIEAERITAVGLCIPYISGHMQQDQRRVNAMGRQSQEKDLRDSFGAHQDASLGTRSSMLHLNDLEDCGTESELTHNSERC